LVGNLVWFSYFGNERVKTPGQPPPTHIRLEQGQTREHRQTSASVSTSIGRGGSAKTLFFEGRKAVSWGSGGTYYGARQGKKKRPKKGHYPEILDFTLKVGSRTGEKTPLEARISAAHKAPYVPGRCSKWDVSPLPTRKR